MAWTWCIIILGTRAKPGNHLCINLRRSRDGAFVRPSVNSCVRVEFGFIQFALGSFYAVHINALSI